MAKENIDVTVELHDALSRPAKRAEDAIDDLGRQVNELSAELALSRAETERQARALAALSLAAEKAQKSTDKNTKSTDKNTKSSKRNAAASKAMGKGLHDAGKGGEFLAKVMSAFKWSGIATAITLAAGAVSALGAAAFAAVAGLAPLVGVMGAMPALGAALGQTLATVKLGFKGVGAALKIVADSTKGANDQAEALAKLSPAAAVFVLQLAHMSKETSRWKAEIQAAMLPKFGAALKNLTPLFPIIEKGLRGSAAAVGDLGYALSDELAGRGKDIEKIMGRNTSIIRNGIGPALVGVTSILLDFMVAGGPLAQRFATWVGSAATRVSELTSHGKETGDLQRFLGRAGDLAATLGRVIGNVAVALFNTGKQSKELSSAMGGGIEGLTARWREWTGTVEGKNAIRDWFHDAIPVVHELGNTVKIIAQAFGDLATNGDLAGLIKMINEHLLPTIIGFSQGAASQLGPALEQAADAFVKFQAMLSYSPMADLLFGIASAANGFLTMLNALPGPLKFAIAAFFAMNLAAKGLAVSIGFLKGTSLVAFFAQIITGAKAGMINTTGLARGMGALQGAAMGAKFAVGGLTTLLTGGAMAALVAITWAYSKWSQRQAEAKARADELKASLDAENGSLTKNSRGLIAAALESEGLIEKSQRVGMSLGDVSMAAEGHSDALERLAQSYVDTALSSSTLDDVEKNLIRRLQESGMSAIQIFDQVKDHSKTRADSMLTDSYLVIDGVRSESNAVGEARGSWERQTAVLDAGSAARRTATRESNLSATALEHQSAAARAARRALIALNDTMVSQQRTLIGFRQAVANSEKVLEKNKHTLNLHTQAGRDNRSALLDVAEAAAAVTNKAERTQAINEARKRITAWADAAGWGADRAKNYADRLFDLQKKAEDVPKHVDTEVKIKGLSESNTALADLSARLGNLHDRTVHINTVTDALPPRVPRRDGGPVWAGQGFKVGEVGPELLVDAAGAISVIGASGQENRRFSGDGYVLPNEFYEALRAEDRPIALASAAPVPVHAGGGSSAAAAAEAPLPDIHNHFHGDASGLTPADVEQAAMRAWRRYENERRERK